MRTFLFFIDGILSEPAMLLGMIALIGLLIQKKSAADSISGTVKTMLGFLVVSGGSSLVCSSLKHFADIFQMAFNIKGIVTNNEAVVSMAQKDFGQEMAVIMFLSMLVNILIARLSPWKYIFLTGHHTLFMSMMVAIILAAAGFEGAQLVALGSIVVGGMMVFSPAIAQPFMRQVMGSDEIAYGHFSSVSCVMAGLIGKYFGDKSRSTESLTIPKSLLFMRDTPVATSLSMSIIFLITCLCAGKDQVQTLAGSSNWLLFAVMQSITFAAGFYIILQGIRMVIAEIIPAFKGISDTIVPNAKPAIDCPVVFPGAPNAVLVGFLSSFSAAILGTFILYICNMTIIIPVPHFFTGAATGVFGNATGGRRGAILGSFAHGLLMSFLPVWLMPVLGKLGFANATFSNSDFCILGILLGFLVVP